MGVSLLTRTSNNKLFTIFTMVLLFSCIFFIMGSEVVEESDAGYEISTENREVNVVEVYSQSTNKTIITKDENSWNIYMKSKAGGGTNGRMDFTVTAIYDSYVTIRVDYDSTSEADFTTKHPYYYNGSSWNCIYVGSTYFLDYDTNYIGYGRSSTATGITMYGYVAFQLEKTQTYNTWARINFDFNGGTGTPSYVENRMTGQTSTSGNVSLTLPSDQPTRDGYAFKGWATSKDGSPIYQPGDTVSISKIAEITYYAIWEFTGFVVTFDSNCGTEIQSQIVDVSGLVLAPEEPTLYGYTFKGWFIDDGTFLDEFDFTTPITSDITLYAKWEGILEYTTDPVSDGIVTAIEGLPGTVSFRATDSMYYSSVLWDFGDGTTSTDLYATHYYSEPGTYTASLTVYNNHGSDVTTYRIEVPSADPGDDGTEWALVAAVVLIAFVSGALIARRFL